MPVQHFASNLHFDVVFRSSLISRRKPAAEKGFVVIIDTLSSFEQITKTSMRLEANWLTELLGHSPMKIQL